ncbi:kinase-like domain-containing protein [Hypoxylon rubiginosum]|uniref:Kinase-like domain-containing protein n=1 Tax=Hypoxylon rubiginosum TaxID=110542 RepID=A0ACB9ZGF0_9PEZI|nr:kinase-like domain-containing protein [Hypoxylon rubiginosum]
MPMWTCDFANCQKPAVRNLGDCILCKRHLCSDHLQDAFHKCPKWEDVGAYDPAARAAEADEITELIKRIDTSALAARASHLREGMPCSIPPLRYDRTTRSSVMGGMNYHIEVCFDDGVKWIARIRRFNATSPPPALRDYIVQSEVATLKFLAKTGVPAPKVFDFLLDHADNPVGVGYILMEKLPGKSLRWSLATQEQKRRVMEQIADVFIELRGYPFELLGSLDCPGDSHVGAFARESLTDFTQSGMRTLGPFLSWEEYHKSSLRLILDQILRREIYSQRAVDAYLIHRFLLDLIPSVLSSSVQDNQKYYLKHADDKGDHILVDEDFNVTGIIDWEWAHTAPPTHAFNSPIGFFSVAQFYSGANDLGDDEVTFARILEGKGHQDLAGFVWNGRLQHRFAFCCGYDLVDWDGFLGLFQGLRDAVSVDEGVDWDQWKTAALHRYREDAGLQLLLSTK